jgi:hypothetical protein
MVSNGKRWVNKIEVDQRRTADKPEWISEYDKVEGEAGPIDFKEGDQVMWVRGLYRYGGEGEANSSSFSGFYQVRDGVIVNQGFIDGEPDFVWGADLAAGINLQAKSSYNAYMPPELRMKLMINGVKDLNDEKAKSLGMPANWKTMRIPQEGEPN